MPASPADPRPKALVAMSGGVDSSVAAALMLEAYQCIGGTLRLIEKDETDINDAREVALKLGIPHYTFDFSGCFRSDVILPFIESYEQGLTPNPCVNCNRHIKFGSLFSKARELGCEVLATGHYARIEKSGGRWLLKKAKDLRKDQSYVLFSLDQETLAHTCFPLGDLTKAEVRELAEGFGLLNAGKQDSQDICFVPDGDYGAFIETYTGKLYPPGDILDLSGKAIGRHRGIIRYTLGQRRGLGVAVNQPVYVAAKDTAQNTITLGPEESLYSKTLTADRINLIACESLERPMRVMVKTRYLQLEKPAWAVQTGADEIRVDFDEEQRALTPGQAAVLYDGDTVIGGGTIRSTI